MWVVEMLKNECYENESWEVFSTHKTEHEALNRSRAEKADLLPTGYPRHFRVAEFEFVRVIREEF